MPESQAGRLALLEELQQIPLKIRAQQQQLQIFGCDHYTTLPTCRAHAYLTPAHIKQGAWHGCHHRLSHQIYITVSISNCLSCRELSEIEMRDLALDLRPYMERTPFVVRPAASKTAHTNLQYCSDYSASCNTPKHPEAGFENEEYCVFRCVGRPPWRGRTACSGAWGCTTCSWGRRGPWWRGSSPARSVIP